MKYHNKALEDSRLHIRAEIKDAKKTHRLQLITERLNDSSRIQEALLPQTDQPREPALCQLYQRRAVSRNLVNCCTT